MKKFLLTVITSLSTLFVFSQGSETFSNIPTGSSSSYLTRTWTGDNGLTWTATDARTDLTISNQAITIRNGSVVCNNIDDGISSLSFKHQQVFSGTGGKLEVRINGTLVGTISPTTSVQTATISGINIPGTFSLEIKQVTSGLRIAIDDVSWTSNNNVTCTTPTAQPTSLNFSNVSTTGMTLDFVPASPAADQYLVVRSTSPTLTENPADGTEYGEGDLLGGGSVIYMGNSTSVYSSGLTGGTTYYYFVFAASTYCNAGPMYNTTNPLVGSRATNAPTQCSAPTATATSLVLNGSSSSVSGSFTASTDADGYLVVMSSVASPGFTPTNGTVYTEGQNVGNATVVSFSTNSSFASTGLAANSTYYYFVYAMNQFGCVNGPVYNMTALSGNASTSSTNTGEPQGYYTNAQNKSCAELKSSLKTIITNGHVAGTYAGLYEQYKLTDLKPREVGSGSSNVIWDMYSDRPTATDPYNYTPGTNECGNYSGEGSCYNREHSFPKSWFNDVMPAYSDYNHIFPTDGYVNGKRSNYRYGEVGTATWTSLNGSKLGGSSTAGISGTVFEPIDEYKGDVARAFLYMVTRYQNLIPTWATYNTDGSLAMSADTFPSVNVSYLKLMLKWHHQDPVSQKEITRNNGTYSFQHNRNPYIDHPEYADLVWNSTCPGLATLPVNVIFFSGKSQGDLVKLEWVAENEVGFDHYEIERSVNGTSYSKVGQVAATNSRNYSFGDNVDALRGQRAYYRLKRVDKDGSFKYSEVISLHIPFNTKFSVYPNPAKTYIQLQLNRNVNGKVTVAIADAMGKIVQQQNITVSGSNITLGTSTLSSGTYLVKLVYNGEQYIQKVMVVK